jgi:hypothetical protein
MATGSRLEQVTAAVEALAWTVLESTTRIMPST